MPGYVYRSQRTAVDAGPCLVSDSVSPLCVPSQLLQNFLLSCVRSKITDTRASVSGLSVGAGSELRLSGLVGRYFLLTKLSS